MGQTKTNDLQAAKAMGHDLLSVIELPSSIGLAKCATRANQHPAA